jgi:uncharacterized protein (AIM24 family)
MKGLSECIIASALAFMLTTILVSGEGFFLARVQGQGILWVQSLGAIIRRDLAPGEQLIVDNGHLGKQFPLTFLSY